MWRPGVNETLSAFRLAKFWGKMLEILRTAPKNLRVFAIFRFSQTSRQLRRSSEGAGVGRRLSGWCGAAGGIYFTSIMFRLKAKAVHSVHLWYVVSAGPSKTSLASASRPEAVSIVLRDHSLSEIANIEKVGRTRFFNLFRTVIAFFLPTLSIVCKLCPREKLPPHLYKSGGKRLR